MKTGWIVLTLVMGCSGSNGSVSSTEMNTPGGGSSHPAITQPETDAGTAHAASSDPPDASPQSDATPSCTPSNWYPDVDADGYGDSASQPTSSCEPPPGYVSNNLDCADHDPGANPHQTIPQTKPVNGPTTTTAWDWNCDGNVVQTYQQSYSVAADCSRVLVDQNAPVPDACGDEMYEPSIGYAAPRLQGCNFSISAVIATNTCI